MKQALEIIKRFEGKSLKAYQDAAGLWTIGYGNRFYQNGERVKPNDVITEQKAEELLIFTVERLSQQVLTHLPGLKDDLNKVAALTSFCYNLGIQYFLKSKLFFMVKSNKNDPQIAEQFIKYRTAGGKPLLGLLRRRLAEATLYFS